MAKNRKPFLDVGFSVRVFPAVLIFNNFNFFPLWIVVGLPHSYSDVKLKIFMARIAVADQH